ncbi:nose resistant to fluoxetine protein 6-like [Armigeres subalbatus]|uniref:nose resistant to fluoxetine protein 6-like n=1 Tax=Armigeres subalbatus TaxID=124917 RepID=UPI002ED5AD7B
MIRWKLMLAAVLSAWCWVVVLGANYEIKRSEYNRMPRLFEYDHYDDCLYSDPEEVKATYCLVRAVIKPDNGSELWRLIENFSSNQKMVLNHAALDRGICITDSDRTEMLGGENASELIVPKFDIDFPYRINYITFRNSDAYKQNYSDIINIMVNKDLTETYGLKAYTEIEYCDRTGVDDFPIDTLDIAFMVIMAVLIILVVLSSCYDSHCKVGFGLNHYREDLPTPRSSLLASFSMIRNWYRLTSRSRDQINRELRPIQSVRYHSFILTLIGHACLMVQPRTGWVLEQKYRELQTMIIVNGFQIISTFILLGGFVFTVMFIQKINESGRKPGFFEIILITVNRYIRLTPVYALVLLFEATWFVRCYDGPFWRRAAETELTFCRRNWWTNMLYINNYYTQEEPCLQHSWYLACDFQLSFIGLLLVTAVLRFPKMKMFLLTLVTSVAAVIPAIVVYKNGFEGVTIFSPEARRFVFQYDDGYIKTYLPTHMYLIHYLIGIIFGLLYFKLKQINYKPKPVVLYRAIWYLLYLIGIAQCFVGVIFYRNDFPKPSLWMSIYAAVSRIVWALIIGFGMMGFVYRISKAFVRFTNIRIFEVFGRLTYGAYVGHFFIIKIMFYNVREPSDMSVFEITTKIHATIYLSYMLSLFLTLLVELPVSAIQKQLLGSLMKPKRKDQNGREHISNGVKKDSLNGGFTSNGFKGTFRGNIN